MTLEYLRMQLNLPAWLFLLCSPLICCATEKHLKLRHVRQTQIHQETHGMGKFCDPSVSNQSADATQKCSSGFYRETFGPNRGQCVSCSCNGLSEECDERTGHCVNCRLNTRGLRCDHCEEGYYGHAANRTCQACPCPFTWNNFALACLDVGLGLVECLCKRGFSGARCERCSFGYFGNPMVPGSGCKPCNCKDGGLNVCDHQAGECISSSCREYCQHCEGCSIPLLLDLEKMVDVLALMKKQLQNVQNHSPASVSRLKNLQNNISDTKTLLGKFSSALRSLDANVEQLEEDVDAIRADLRLLIKKTLKTTSDVERVSQSVNGSVLKVEDLLSGTEALLTALHDLTTRLTEVKPGESDVLSEEDGAVMMEEAQWMVQDVRERSCSAQRDGADREQEEAHTLLDFIRSNKTGPASVLHQSADALMAFLSSLSDISELLANAEDRVDTTKRLNLKSSSELQQLQHHQAQLERDLNTLAPVTDTTKDLLKNISNLFTNLEDIKKEFESHAALIDGAKLQLFKELNTLLQMKETLDVVTRAEEHSEKLYREAVEIEKVLHNTTHLLSVLHGGDYYVINAVEKAEKAANHSRASAAKALQGVNEGGLISRAAGLTENSTNLRRHASDTQSDLNKLSQTVSHHQDKAEKQKEKAQSIRQGIVTTSADLRSIRRDDTAALIESVKTAASACNSSISPITERLRSIRQDVDGLTVTNASVNAGDADQALKKLNSALPVLKDKLQHVEALSVTAPPGGNLTESIRRIREIIEESRTLVKRLPLATTFDGNSHIELHPLRNLEDIKAFTAVDLLLSVDPNRSSKKRRRRQDKHREHSFFVFYLGNSNTSGDYIGMAIRKEVLICVYKLGGVVHELETFRITITNNVSEFDRVVLHRVYQDAVVNITQNFTSQSKHQPISNSSLYFNLTTMTSILQLDPDWVVFYVGGYPEDFTPPVELHYPRFRGAMKLSYINDNPVSLFNYKRAVHLKAEQPAVKISTSEASDYYEGTGYCLALLKEPDKIKKRLFKFHTNSRETNALIFYIGNEETFFCLFLDRGYLVLQGRQAGRELRVQSPEKVSLFDKTFAIIVASKFTVHFGPKQISLDHIQTTYSSYYIGGLPTQLRRRHNITAVPLRGCVDHLTADTQIVEYSTMIGVGKGCPVPLLGVRTATLYSALPVDSLLVVDKEPLTVSLGFRTTHLRSSFLRSSSQGSASVHDLQLSLDDGFAVFSVDNYTLRSEKMYNDGRWHYLSAARRKTGLELSIDNRKVIQEQAPQIRPKDPSVLGGKFKGCITNLYTRSDQSVLPADLSSLSITGDLVLGQCDLHPPPRAELLPEPVMKKLDKHKPAPVGIKCWSAQRPEYQLLEVHSWVKYTVPQQDLNHRPHFSLDIKTRSSEGLIFYVAGRGPLLALFISKGKIRMSLQHGRIIHHKQKSNDGDWHRVEFSVEKSSFHLLVDGLRATDGHLPNDEGSSLDLMNPVYLGVDPTGRVANDLNIPRNSVIGCIRNLKMNEVAVGEPEESFNTLPCSDRPTEMGTYFSGGYIITDVDFPLSAQFVFSIEFRPETLTALIFHVSYQTSSLSVSLKENKVIARLSQGLSHIRVSVTPPESLCDGQFHLLTVYRQQELIKLEVDSLSEQRDINFTSTSSETTSATLHIGGSTLSGLTPFVGCMRNVALNGRHVSFGGGSSVFPPVSLFGCPAE